MLLDRLEIVYVNVHLLEDLIGRRITLVNWSIAILEETSGAV